MRVSTGPFHAVFIRAPRAESAGEGVEVIALECPPTARSSRCGAATSWRRLSIPRWAETTTRPLRRHGGPRVMRVMGIDLGLTVRPRRRRTPRVERAFVYVGVARTDKDLATHFSLRTIADAIDTVIEQYQPEVVAIERVFAQDKFAVGDACRSWVRP